MSSGLFVGVRAAIAAAVAGIYSNFASIGGSALLTYMGEIANTSVTLKRRLSNEVWADDVGLTEASADNVAAYNAAVALIVASVKKKKLRFPYGTYKFLSGITLDMTLMSLKGEGVVFDFSGMSTDAKALTVTGSVGDIYSSIKEAMGGVSLMGPGTGGSSLGLFFDAPTTVGAAHISLRDGFITGFFDAIGYDRNAYIITFDHFNVFGNSRGFQTKVGVSSNSGEKITFVNSAIFNNVYGLRVEDPNASIFLVNTSLDYNEQNTYLSAGSVNFVGGHQEFSDKINGNDPRFLYADAEGVNTAFVSYTGVIFKIGTVAELTAIPVFDVTSTVNLSHANCEFYLNTNRAKVFKMRTGSFYNETGAKAQYAGAAFRELDAGCAYSIDSTGQNQVGIKTSGNMAAAAPDYAVNSVAPITDIFTAGYGTGQTATSNVALENGVYTLYTHTQSSANSATVGQYLIHRQGAQTVVATVSADVWVTVAVNGEFKVTVTNASGSKTLEGILVRNAAQTI